VQYFHRVRTGERSWPATTMTIYICTYVPMHICTRSYSYQAHRVYNGVFRLISCSIVLAHFHTVVHTIRFAPVYLPYEFSHSGWLPSDSHGSPSVFSSAVSSVLSARPSSYRASRVHAAIAGICMFVYPPPLFQKKKPSTPSLTHPDRALPPPAPPSPAPASPRTLLAAINKAPFNPPKALIFSA